MHAGLEPTCSCQMELCRFMGVDKVLHMLLRIQLPSSTPYRVTPSPAQVVTYIDAAGNLSLQPPRQDILIDSYF